MPNPHTLSDLQLMKAPDHNVTATGNGGSVDCLGYQRALIALVATTAASSSVAAVLEESSDNTNWANVSGLTIPTIAASKTAFVQTVNVNLKKRLRYLRLGYTVTGTAGADAVYVLAAGEDSPPTQDNAPVSI